MKHAQRSQHVHNTHNIQVTSLNNTIDEHFSQTWSPGHHPRQDHTRNYPKQTRQHTIYKNASDKYHKPPQYLLQPRPVNQYTNNGTAQTEYHATHHDLLKTQTKDHLNQIARRNTREETSNKKHIPSQPNSPSADHFSLQNNHFKIFRHLNITRHVDGSCTAIIHDAPLHSQTNVEFFPLNSRPAIMFSSSARFNALSASLTASFPPAKHHFSGDYISLSQTCAQHGQSLVLLNEHLSSLGSLKGIQDFFPFNIPDRITNISEEYRAAFLLADNARDETLLSLRTYENATITEVENLRASANSHSTNIETYLFQLAAEQKLLQTTQELILSMARETFESAPKFDALPPDITKPLFASIEEATQLLQDTVSTAHEHSEMINHHRTLLGHVITSLTLYPSIALHRMDHFADLARQERRPQGDLSLAKTYYSPNLHLLRMATESQIAAARAAATAFDEHGNRAATPVFPLGPFHLFPLPFLSMNPYAKGIIPGDIQPNDPRFDFLAIKNNMGPSFSHRPAGSKKDYPIRIVWTGWNPGTHTPSQIQRVLYSLELDMHESAVFPPRKRREASAPAICHIVYTKMSNLLWACIAAGGGFIHGIPLACKVAVGTGDITIGKYHYWGTVSASASHLHPIHFMSHAEEYVFQAIGIHIKICPQQLTPNWLAACCHHGRFDLVFQNPRDADKYVKYANHPITPEVMTGFGTLIESAVLSGEIKLREDMGPFQIELISLPPTVTEGTLTRYLNAKGLDFCGMTKRATKSRTNTWTIGFEFNMPDRLDAANALGNALVPHLSRNPLRINVKQRNIPRGSCIICYHETNTEIRCNHSYKQCNNRDRVCPYCHQASHLADRCPYVVSGSYREPEAREPEARPIAAPRFHSVRQSPEARAAVALGRRSMASAKARGKNPFSDDEEDSGGEDEKEPPLPPHLQPAAGIAAAHRSDTDWASASDLTGAVNSSNSFSWNPPTGSPQNRGYGSAAYTTPKTDSRTRPTHSPLNPPSANSGGKRATTTSPTTASKKKRQVDQEGASGAVGATGGTNEDKDDDDLY